MDTDGNFHMLLCRNSRSVAVGCVGGADEGSLLRNGRVDLVVPGKHRMGCAARAGEHFRGASPAQLGFSNEGEGSHASVLANRKLR